MAEDRRLHNIMINELIEENRILRLELQHLRNQQAAAQQQPYTNYILESLGGIGGYLVYQSAQNENSESELL
ncbi:MAG: hypothetical protein AAF380_01135 [Bacteroidota bacterium]